MSNRARGCYITLLCHCWLQGSIPDSIESIAILCGETSAKMAKLWPEIEPCFTRNELNPSRFENKRLQKERAKQLQFHSKMSVSGKKGMISRYKTVDNQRIGSNQVITGLPNQVITRDVITSPNSSSSSSSSSSKAITVAPRGNPPYPPESAIQPENFTLGENVQNGGLNDERSLPAITTPTAPEKTSVALTAFESEVPTAESLVATLGFSGIPEDFIRPTYDIWVCKEGLVNGRPMTAVNYVRYRWRYEETQWRAGNHSFQPKEKNGNRSTNRKNYDRNAFVSAQTIEDDPGKPFLQVEPRVERSSPENGSHGSP